jgi:protein-S-isoprenylcysteine O-methyltransferase Ste14
MAMSNKMTKKSRFKSDAASGEHPYGDLGQIICLIVFVVVWGLDSFVFRFSTFLAGFVPFYIRWTVAAAAFILGVILARNGHRVVYDNSPAEGQLVKDGAFARLRHPLYGGSLLFYVSLFLGSLSLLSLVAFAAIFLFYDFIARYEEKILDQKYGQDYREYKRNVPKWIPRLRPARLT